MWLLVLTSLNTRDEIWWRIPTFKNIQQTSLVFLLIFEEELFF